MLEQMGQKARAASRIMARATTEQKNNALSYIANELLRSCDEILAANQDDVLRAEKAGITKSLLDRLTLNKARLENIGSNLRDVVALPDPVGEVFDSAVLSNGLLVHKRRVPLGALAVIYEARPNVTVDVAGLAIKTGNVVILRGGSETLKSNRVLVRVIRNALSECHLPANSVQFVDDPSRDRVYELLQMHDYIDMLIPRGGAGLHRFCRENSRIPVITGGIGICHLFVDESAEIDAAINVIQNAKVQRPTVCNALDTALIHHSIAAEFLPRLVKHLAESGVSFRADEKAQAILAGFLSAADLGLSRETGFSEMGLDDQGIGELKRLILPAGPNDFKTEWLSLVLGLKVVDNLDDAIDHISTHGTGHSDGILTRDEENAQRFLDEVDSAAVYLNASTRFTDGGQLGLGAEVAISTQRLHARGPMGLRELTTYKWVIMGENHVRE
jgi:glutamate-5-semialdehyde dehydrogenase